MRKRFPFAAAVIGAWLLGCAAAHEVRSQTGGGSPSAAASGTTPAAVDSARPFPLGTPDPRAFGDSTLTRKEQEEKDKKFREALRWGHIDSMHLNEKVVLALHAVPRSERRKMEEMGSLVDHCDELTTGVAPGDWDIYVIAAGFDMITGVSLSFNFPEDWTVHGFTPNPEIGTPLILGDVRNNSPRPLLIAFDCVTHPGKLDKMPTGLKQYKTAKTAVIGRIELSAPSAGSFVLADNPNPTYGPPEVANCWGGRTNDVRLEGRGRIDVGQGPGFRPCSPGGPLIALPAATDSATAAPASDSSSR